MAESIAGPSRSSSESPGVSLTIGHEGFTVLYNGEGAILADVVFIHGLGGGPEKTWTKEFSSHPDHSRRMATLWAGMTKRRKVKEQTNVNVGRSVFWPRDLLPLKIADIRILTYGYDSKIVNGRNQNGIYQHAENMLSALDRIRGDVAKDPARKIIFVAHSLGGVIVKEVLRQSSNHTHQAHLLAIFHDTYGVIFLGCPHRGSSATEWGVIAANIVKLGGLSSNTDLLRSLGADSQTLSSLSLDFSRYLRDRSFKVHSFREEQGMTGLAGISGKVVDDASSIIGDADEGKEGINANHRDMGRFGSLEDEGFLKIAGVISRYVQDLRNIRTSADHAARQELKRESSRKMADLSKEERECLQSLAHADYSTYRGRIPAHQRGTLEWVREHDVYQQWDSKDTSSALLWISGNPGCGKTVMSAFLLDRLEIEVRATDARVAYFFCDDKEGSQKSAQSLLRGVIHQLISKTPSLIKHAMGAYWANGTKMIESLDLLWGIFISAAADPVTEGCYLVLDGLDECEKVSRNDFLRRLNNYLEREVNQTSMPYLKVLITSRPYREIELLLSKHQIIRLKTEDEGSKIQADITRFISQKVDEMEEVCHYNSELKERVRAKLASGADGMFLWVALVVQELLDTPIHLVPEALETTPDSLNDLYTHLLTRLKGRKAEIVTKILTWVVRAPEPMSVIGLAVACAVKSTDESESSIDHSLVAGFAHDIALCGPILKVQLGVVYLVHQSAKEFLLNPRLRDSLGEFSVRPERANCELAITCLTYLSFDDIRREPHHRNPPYDPDEIPMLEDGRRNDFHLFAARWWPVFVRESGERHPDVYPTFCRLAKFNDRLSNAFERGTDRHETHLWDCIAPLYVSSYYGLYSLCESLLNSGADVNGREGPDGSPLQAAALKGHEMIINLLLGHGADVNAQGSLCSNALQAAASIGAERLILLLLEHGAHINGEGKMWGNALQAAVQSGSEQSVQLLLERGANPNPQVTILSNPLWTAAYYGRDPIVQLLVEHGADVNAQGKNVLQAAVLGGSEKSVLLLLERGADPNARAGDWGTALQIAASASNKQFVLLLLNHGANVNACEGPEGSALQMAVRRGNEELVRLLLERGADPNICGGDQGNALQAAACRGHEAIVQMLWERGADLNADGGSLGTALQAAVCKDNEKLVLLLLERGADPNSWPGPPGNALQVALSIGNDRLFSLLLDYGADVNAHGGPNGLALRAARRETREAARLAAAFDGETGPGLASVFDTDWIATDDNTEAIFPIC